MSSRKKIGLTITILTTLAIVFSSLFIVGQFTDWELAYQLMIPGAILALGTLITLIIGFWGRTPAAAPATTTPCPTPAPAPAPKPAAKTKAVAGDVRWYHTLLGFAILIGGACGIYYYAIPWVNNTFKSVMGSLPDHPPHIEGILPIGHDAKPPTVAPPAPAPVPIPSSEFPVPKPAVEYDQFYKVISAGRIYDVFHLYHKQMWTWTHLEDDIEYRVLDTGNEGWETVSYRRQGQNWQARDHAGLLQIRINHGRQRVQIVRQDRSSE